MSAPLPVTSFTIPLEACGRHLSDIDKHFSLEKEAFAFGRAKKTILLFKLDPKAPEAPRACGGAGESPEEFVLPKLHLSAFTPVKKQQILAGRARSLLTNLIEIGANYKHVDPSVIASLPLEHQSLLQLEDFQRFCRTVDGAESLFSKKQRAFEKMMMLSKGSSAMFEESIILKESYWQECLLKDHPYGEDVASEYFPMWRDNPRINCNFEDWLMLRPEDRRPDSSVRYLDETQRAAYQVDIIDGFIMQKGAPLNTQTIKSKKAEGYAIYVISPDYKMYVGPYELGRFHHSSFLSGAPVIGAGEIQTDEHGKILMISSKSGHYKPTAMQLHNTFDFLRAHGVNLSRVKLIENHAEGLTRHDSIQEFINTSPSPTKQLSSSPFKRGAPSPFGGKGGFIISRVRSTSSSAESPVPFLRSVSEGGACGGAGGGKVVLSAAGSGGPSAKKPLASPTSLDGLEF